MNNNQTTINFTDPSKVTGLTSAKGDLISGDASGGLATTSIGADGTILTASSGAAGGIAWGAAGAISLGDLTDVTDATTGTAMTLSGALVTSNIGLGQGVIPLAGASVSATSIGHFSLDTLTTGIENTAFGAGSLRGVTTGINNTAIGSGAMNSVTTVISDNTSLGKDAGANVNNRNVCIGSECMDLTGVADDNVGIGYHALRNCTTGNVVAVGHLAAEALTSADGVVAIGKSACVAVTTGRSNTGVGESTLGTLTTGVSNVAIGSNAMNTCGIAVTANIAMGRLAMSDITGDSNVGIGFQCMLNSTLAANTVAIGRDALGIAITTGANNVAIGRAAMADCTSGFSNTAVGRSALGDCTIGSGNTVIGSGALRILTTGSNNIAIGNLAGNTLTTQSTTISIGVTAQATATSAIQLGTGTNSTASTLQFLTQQVSTASWIGGGTTGASINNTGDIIRTPSDQRIKENIIDIDNSLDLINMLQPRHFDYIDNYKEKMGNSGTGFIAQEIIKVIPETVNDSGIPFDNDSGSFLPKLNSAKAKIPDDTLLGVDMIKLIPYLVKSIQELKQEIELLKSK